MSAAAWSYEHVHDYLEICRRARAALDAGGRVRLRWNEEPMDDAAWRRAFRDALDRRINLKAGTPPAWRKLDPSYQTELRRDARWINEWARSGRRLRPPMNRWGTAEIQARYAHVLAREW